MKQKLAKKTLAAAMAAIMVIGISTIDCFAREWNIGSSKGTAVYGGDSSQAYVKVGVSSGDATELYAQVATLQKNNGTFQTTEKGASDYGESTYSVAAVKKAESGYKIISYSGYGKVKTTEVINTYGAIDVN